MLGVIIHCLISWHHPTDTGKSGLDCLFFLVGIFSNWDEKQPKTLFVFHLSSSFLSVSLSSYQLWCQNCFIYLFFLLESQRVSEGKRYSGFRWSVAVFLFAFFNCHHFGGNTLESRPFSGILFRHNWFCFFTWTFSFFIAIALQGSLTSHSLSHFKHFFWSLNRAFLYML